MITENKKTAYKGGLHVGIFLFSQAVTSQVFSAPMSLTSVFGMGTGGPSLQSTPTAAFRQAIQFCLALQGLVTRTGIEPMFAA